MNEAELCTALMDGFAETGGDPATARSCARAALPERAKLRFAHPVPPALRRVHWPIARASRARSGRDWPALRPPAPVRARRWRGLPRAALRRWWPGPLRAPRRDAFRYPDRRVAAADLIRHGPPGLGLRANPTGVPLRSPAAARGQAAPARLPASFAGSPAAKRKARFRCCAGVPLPHPPVPGKSASDRPARPPAARLSFPMPRPWRRCCRDWSRFPSDPAAAPGPALRPAGRW